MNHIRYSGSPIPLSFSETDDKKQVIVLEFKNGNMISLQELEVPCNRKLIRIKGDFEKVKTKLVLLEDPQTLYPAWVEVQVETQTFIFDLEEQLNSLIANKPFIGRLFPRQFRIRAARSLDEQTEEAMALADLDPKTVFLKKCSAEYPEEEHADLLKAFSEVMEYMVQKEDRG
jgi:exonuclease SbcD